MRKILFKGKRFESQDWIEGDLLIDGCNDVSIRENHCTLYYDIIPETVGQYTGLTDKNGKKIFEGDIVHLYAGEHSISRYKGIDYNALVIFRDGGFCAIDGTEEDYSLRRYNFVSQSLYCEVIGNIHDNPELLKEADNK